MAELATIIKEVAEKLVIYFNKRRLEIGWDDSTPKPVVGHLIPKPNVTSGRSFKRVDKFPDLRRLFSLLESEGFEVEETKTEQYIKNALEECISKMNFPIYQDLIYSSENAPKVNKEVARFSKEERKGEGDIFPPVTMTKIPTRRTTTPVISQTSAERIVNSAAKMLANLLRLTKTAYVQQNERGSNVYSVRNILDIGFSEQRVHHSSASNRKSFVYTPVANLEHPMKEDSTKKKQSRHKANVDDAQLASHLIQKNPGCTLFTRVSTASNSEVSASMNVKEVLGKFGRECCDSTCSGPTAIENHPPTTESSVEIDRRNCPCVHKEANSRVKFAVKRNLRHLLPTSSFAKANTNLSVHRDSSYVSQPQKSPGLSRSPVRIALANRQEVFGQSTISPLYSVQFSKESKHADIVTNTEILEQARKYGSWNFVSRLTHEINRCKTLSEPREGYWMPKRQCQSFDFLTNKQSPARSSPRSFHHLTTRKPVVSGRKHTRKTLERSASPAKHMEMSSSNTYDYSASANCTLGPVSVPSVRIRGSHFPSALTFEKTVSSLEDQELVCPRTHADDKGRYETKNSPVQGSHLSSLKMEDASRSEKLRKLAIATANALTDALGIPTEDLNSQIVAGFGEAIRASAKKRPNNKITPKSQQTAEGNKLQVKHAQVNELSSPSSGDSVVYRLRVESVRHCRLKQSDSYKDFYPPGPTKLPNPTPPMSIILRGVNCSSPSLKLISAELARLGEVAGHPVILRDPHMLGQQSGKRQPNVGDITRSVLDTPSVKSVSPKEGWPQVDYFAIVCCSLGKILGVDVNPIIHGVKHSRYDWFIKTITIDELEKQKKYLFHCHQWLTVEDRTLRCKRVRISSATAGLENKATHQTPESALSIESTSQQSVHVKSSSSTSMSELPKSARLAVVDLSTPKSTVQLNANRVEAPGDSQELFTDRTVATQKTTLTPKLLNFSKIVKAHECEKYRTVYENEQRFWGDDNFAEPEGELGQKATMISVTAKQVYYNLECFLPAFFTSLEVKSFDITQESESVDPIYECLRIQSTATQSEIISMDSDELDQYNWLIPSELLEHKLYLIASHMFTFLDNWVFAKPPLPNIEPLPIPDLVQTIDVERAPPTFVADVSPEELAHIAGITSFPTVMTDSPAIDREWLRKTTGMKPQSTSVDGVEVGVAENSSLDGKNKAGILDDADEAQYDDEEKWEQDESELDDASVIIRVNVTSLDSSVDSQYDVDELQSVITENAKLVSMTEENSLQNVDIYFDPHNSAMVDDLEGCLKTNTEQLVDNSTVLFPYLNECDMERRLRQIAGWENIQSSSRLDDVACESIPPTQLLLDTNASPTTVVSTDDSQVTVICCAPTGVIENTTDMDKRLVDQLNNSQGDNQFIHLCEISMGCRQSGNRGPRHQPRDLGHMCRFRNRLRYSSEFRCVWELLNRLKGQRTWCAGPAGYLPGYPKMLTNGRLS
ncbi:hypothetical protein EG68_05344 [Paragonimus skrjabini miyazakii]|uniref:PLAT domain-containing protein n=1 Tax=Paragonimus skrjabini miyazakii TaxID=59628 RepID=A0A8S9YVP2_9TREM|nr:hypothetical protein EG68_05344 [Paragonimus skrjabini miyazakii]